MISIPPLVHFKNGISSSLAPLAIPKPLWRTIRLFVLFLFLFMLSLFWIRRLTQPFDGQHQQQQTKLIVITPTHKRTERLADLTRLSQTLMHVKDNLHWILVEDGDQRSAAVVRLLRRSSIPHSYLVNRTEPGFPGRGWPQRNRALDFVRREYANFGGLAVIYFADDDNSYDLRLFRNFLPGVRTIGFWAVGLVRHGFIEAPRVKKSRIVGWETWNAPADVEFAIDMAGFGISLGLVRQHRAYFHKDCSRAYPEDCFLRQFGLPAVDCQPFGFDSTPKEVLVWHTKTYSLGTNGSTFDYVIAE